MSKAKTEVISRDEWLEALGEAAEPCDPTAQTLQELQSRYGISRSIAYRKVLLLIEEGKATRTWKLVNGKKTAAYKLTSKK